MVYIGECIHTLTAQRHWCRVTMSGAYRRSVVCIGECIHTLTAQRHWCRVTMSGVYMLSVVYIGECIRTLTAQRHWCRVTMSGAYRRSMVWTGEWRLIRVSQFAAISLTTTSMSSSISDSLAFRSFWSCILWKRQKDVLKLTSF